MGLFNDKDDKNFQHEILRALQELAWIGKQTLSAIQQLLATTKQILAEETPPIATSLKITWGVPTPSQAISAKKKRSLFQFEENNMPVQLNPGQSVPFTVSPLNAGGGASPATLTNLSFVSSDPAVFTVVPDPTNPLGGIVTAQTPPTSPDAAALTVTADATEPDGVTTETGLTGTDTVTVGVLTPPPPVAASLQITWGTPAKKK